MELEKQVVNFELAQELKAKGHPQLTSVWLWYHNKETREWYLVLRASKNWFNNEEIIAAPTVAELGDVLKDCSYYFPIFEGKCVWAQEHLKVEEETEANARARMLIWLIKRKQKLNCKGGE